MNLEKLRSKVRPEHTAFLIIDMQKDYCCEGGTFDRRGFDVKPAQHLAVRLNDFLDKARAILTWIIHLKMTKIPGMVSPASTELYGRLGIDRKPDPAYAEFYQVIPREGEIVIPKYKYSGFHSTYLDQVLRANDIKTLILTGVATNVCVESTARDGFMRDYYVVVPGDLTEGSSADAKTGSLHNINTFFGEVVDSRDLLSCWGIKP
jgi:ureidoacrylate peracid hydrolase